jgi:hypothetical protein
MEKASFVTLIVLGLCAPLVLGIAGLSPSNDAPRLVLFPPWKDGVELVRHAGGEPIGPEQAPMGLLAFAHDGMAFDRRVRDAGAWAVIDGTLLSRLCGISTCHIPDGSMAVS